MTVKGNFIRAPTIRMDGFPVPSVRVMKLLGVLVDERLSFAQHARHIGEMGAKSFGRMSRVSTSSWGVRYGALRLLYRGTYVATITYAAAVWYKRVGVHVVRSPLLRTQRPALILLTKAYRSVSTSALPVLAGVLPADLEVLRAGTVCDEGTKGNERELTALRRATSERVMRIWQDRWDAEGKGRDTYKFIPSIIGRMERTFIELDHQMSQIISGHGSFRGRLRDMALSDSGTCECGESEEYRDHVLWDCPLYGKERAELLNALMRGVGEGPLYFEDLVSCRINFDQLKRFAHAWFRKRRLTEMYRGGDGDITA